MTQPIQFLSTYAQRRDGQSLGPTHPDAGPSFRHELNAATSASQGSQNISLDDNAIVSRFNENGFFAEIAAVPAPSSQSDALPVTSRAPSATVRARAELSADLTPGPADPLQATTPAAICGAPTLPHHTLVPGRALPANVGRGNRTNPPSLVLKLHVAAARLQEGALVEGDPLSRSGLRPPHAGKSSDFHLLLFMSEGIAEVVGRLASLDEAEHSRLLAAIDALFSDHGISAHRVILNGAGKPPLVPAKGN